jgi:hypothetical protein
MRFLSAFLFALPALAAASGAPPPDTSRQFVSACMLAFDQSSGNGSLGVGRQICECTAKESLHQGATVAALRRETAKIKADPKHPIEDPHVLDAFHYCTIETLK